MLGHIGRRAAIFAAQRKSLRQPQYGQHQRRQPADMLIGRQQSDRECGGAHQHDGDEERIFAAEPVADAAEIDGAERPDQEAGGIGRKRREQRGGIVAMRKEKRCKERRESGVKIEIVPFEDGAEGGREHHLAVLSRADEHNGGLAGRLPCRYIMHAPSPF